MLGAIVAGDRSGDFGRLGAGSGAEVFVAQAVGVALSERIPAWWTSRSIIATAVTSSPKISPARDRLVRGDDQRGALVAGRDEAERSTFVVALAAGIAGMAALETRASAAVGVAISVTTVPAASYLGVAARGGRAHQGLDSVAGVGINVTMLITGGTVTLLVQDVLGRRAASNA